MLNMLKLLLLSSESKQKDKYKIGERKPFHPTTPQRYIARFDHTQDTLYNEYSMKRSCASSFSLVNS